MSINAVSTRDITPFSIWDNVYFIGCRAVSVHLIDTGAGLILIDTGYPFMRSALLQNMKELGFNPADIRILLHSHGHYDHFGNTMFLKSLSGSQTYVSQIDNEIINGHRDLSWAAELGFDRLPPFDCDVLLGDGDEIQLGCTRILCRLTPGHTEGTMSFFFETSDGLRTAMHGGVGMNSMARRFLDQHDLPAICRSGQGLHRLKQERVDIVLRRHRAKTTPRENWRRLAGEKAPVLMVMGTLRASVKRISINEARRAHEVKYNDRVPSDMCSKQGLQCPLNIISV